MESISRARRSLLGIGCLLVATVPACQSFNPGREPGETQAASGKNVQPSMKPGASRLAKTDFEAKVTKSQAFNTHVAMGKNAMQQGNYPLAATELQKALDVSAHSAGRKVDSAARAEAHRQLAKVYDHLGRFPLAEEHYGKAQKLAPNDPRVWNDLGYSYYLQGRYDMAEKSLRGALKLDPNSSGGYTNLGLTLAAAGKTDEALAVLSKMGGPAVGHANLGYMLAALGRPDEARAQYRKAIELRPNLVVVKSALAKLDSPSLPPLPQTLVAAGPSRANVDPNLQLTAAAGVNPERVPVQRANLGTSTAPPTGLPITIQNRP